MFSYKQTILKTSPLQIIKAIIFIKVIRLQIHFIQEKHLLVIVMENIVVGDIIIIILLLQGKRILTETYSFLMLLFLASLLAFIKIQKSYLFSQKEKEKSIIHQMEAIHLKVLLYIKNLLKFLKQPLLKQLLMRMENMLVKQRVALIL